MLLYADDAVLFSKSPVHLQEMLNKLHEYSQTWGLQVNTSKTKIMIFERVDQLALSSIIIIPYSKMLIISNIWELSFIKMVV